MDHPTAFVSADSSRSPHSFGQFPPDTRESEPAVPDQSQAESGPSPHGPEGNAPIRLLIVDDSVVMRELLSQVFEEEGGFDVRLAENGIQAVEMNRIFQPDVVTLDVVMPKMDGIAALSQMMADRKVPVVMVSSMTTQGAFATLEALNLGAVDFITKPTNLRDTGIERLRLELLSKVRCAHGSRPKVPAHPLQDLRPGSRMVIDPIRQDPAGLSVVLIGASTGGPRTVEEILQTLPSDFPWPIVVALHIPSPMSKALAERLNEKCALTVVEVGVPMILQPANVYVAKGGADVEFSLQGGRLAMIPKLQSKDDLRHPSLETLGRSILNLCEPSRVIGVILTGRGSDGADSFSVIRKSGGRTIAESESSSMVFEMPAALIGNEGATVVLPMEAIAAQMVEWVAK